MDIRPIHTEEDYDAALADVQQYFVSEPARGTPEGDRFEILLALIGNYEQKRWAIEPPNDPVEAISLIMQDRGLDQKELGVLLGSRSRASELLRRIRPLSMEQAQTLYREWHVPAEVLLAPSIVGQTRTRRAAARRVTSPVQKRAAKSPAAKRTARKAQSVARKKSAPKSAAQKKRTAKRLSSR